MSETPPEESAAASSASRDERNAQQRKSLPIWLWILLAGILVVIVFFIALPLFTGGGGTATETPGPSASTSDSASPTPGATTGDPTTTPTPIATTPAASPDTFDNPMTGYLADVLNSQNTAVLSQGGTFSNPVHVFAANSGVNQNMTPDEAVGAMAFMFTPSDAHPWNLALPDSVLATYRAGPYGDHFPAGAIVARSHDGHVFSFIGHDSTIERIFMAASEDLLH